MVRRREISLDRFLLAVVLLAYLAGQLLIGTYLPADGKLHFDTPADIDFLYYAGILNQMKVDFPPQNPAYGGVPLSQSFVQYYPTMLVSLFTNPYLAMRVANLLMLALLALVLKRYFSPGWGLGLVIIGAGSVGFGLINSLGIDLVARGFNHFPFFIAAIVALFERKRVWLRWGSLFLLGWFHSYLALLTLLYLGAVVIIERFGRRAIIDGAICALGLASASIIITGAADKAFYFPLVEGFGFSLQDLWMHAVPAVVLCALSGNGRLLSLCGIALVFGALFHYNPFFPIFMLYFAAALAAIETFQRGGYRRATATGAAILLLIGFLINGYGKYNPCQGHYLPHLDQAYAKAGEWLAANTPSRAVILVAPLLSDWSCRLMETRAVYLGFPPHVAHLGIDWRERAQKTANYFSYPAVYIVETGYVVYGPNERKVFPSFGLKGDPVYRDEQVTIWKNPVR